MRSCPFGGRSKTVSPPFFINRWTFEVSENYEGGTSDETFSLDLEKTVYRIGREGDVVLVMDCGLTASLCILIMCGL